MAILKETDKAGFDNKHLVLTTNPKIVSNIWLEESQKSPNGKWQNIYLGNGSGGVTINKGNNEFFLSPGISRSINETNAGLVNSTGTYCNFVLKIDVKTVKPLRENDAPNTWR